MSIYDDILKQFPTIDEWSDSDQKIMLEPYTYLGINTAKELPSMVTKALNHWYQVPQPALDIVLQIVGPIHAACLLIDDIQDDSDLRGGNPVAHKVYGVAQTINTATYVCFDAYHKISELRPFLKSPETIDLWSIINDEIAALHRGQWIDLYWRDSLICPTEEEYLRMIHNKTGAIFRLPMRLLQALSPVDSVPDCFPLVNIVGILVQIRNDLLSLSADFTKDKGFCEDFSEGKFSFPIIHSVKADSSNSLLMDILRLRPKDEATKMKALRYMKDQTKSLDHTFDVLCKLEKTAKQELEKLGGNSELSSIFERIHLSPTPEIEDH
uniref:IDS-like terpene synthase 1 n=1 Tax=Melampsora larici-populina (strain 98AG31 / pathotype 3-4-7) TaxID=747676 RepID=TPS1_MELLP|nr:RecName: Full=IDS-like terpene synthase 1; Short=ILTPS1 [Melampsora larici-populina 98AG31]QIG55790.1 terpene synthase [Melampsora laricis-populina]